MKGIYSQKSILTKLKEVLVRFKSIMIVNGHYKARENKKEIYHQAGIIEEGAIEIRIQAKMVNCYGHCSNSTQRI